MTQTSKAKATVIANSSGLDPDHVDHWYDRGINVTHVVFSYADGSLADGQAYTRTVEGREVPMSGEDWLGPDLRWAIADTSSAVPSGEAPTTAVVLDAITTYRRSIGCCPSCGLSGVTPEQAAQIAPAYIRALQSLPAGSVPDEPSADCWDCRRLRAGGHDPAALIDADRIHGSHPIAKLHTPPTGDAEELSWTSMSDYDLVGWLAQYAGKQAGYYPALRRQRIAAESEAARRGLAWKLAQQPGVTDVSAALAGRSVGVSS